MMQKRCYSIAIKHLFVVGSSLIQIFDKLPNLLYKLITIHMQRALLLKIKQATKHLQEHGYAVVKDFISPQTCETAIQQIDRLVDNFEPSPQNITIFDAKSGTSQHRLSKYFLQSSDKVSFFFQPKAFKDGNLVVPKRQAINKIGHSLHQHNKIFEEITYTPGTWQICHETGINNPLVMQSMAILKPPKIGGEVNIHQDSTYLYGEPDTLLGFWIPLQNATKTNGCLWGLPGSHKGKLYHRSKVTNRVPADQFYHEKDYKQEDFVPLEMERGSLAIFTGKFLHKSHDNGSNVSRYAYTWHLMDSSSKWSPQNWLQRPYFPQFLKRELV